MMFILLLLLVGCITQPTREPQDHADLLHWTDKELIPYLKQTLTTHPRLRGETFAVVSTRDGEIQPRIDGLTLDLRHRIGDALMSEPGIRMAWRHGGGHHRRLQGADCGDRLRAGWFVAIEIEAEATGGWRAAVRFLDAGDRTWVNGLGLSWRGSLDARQRHALTLTREDELLRGLRVLPFAADQPDLAAAYFANNLSCLVQQRGLSEESLYVEPLEHAPPQLATLVSLLDNNLSRLRQVEVTTRPEEAAYRVHSELHRIDAGLYQLWVALLPKDSGVHVPGLDTAAYIRLSATAQALSPAPVTVERPQPSPRITGLRLLRPPRPGLCRETDTWAAGAVPVAAGETLDAHGCFRVEATAEPAGRVYLLLLDPRGRLSRIDPGRCGPTVPTPGGGSGIATLYALAAGGSWADQGLERHFRLLPDACDGAAPDAPLPTGWSTRLDRLLAVRAGTGGWTALRVRVGD